MDFVTTAASTVDGQTKYYFQTHVLGVLFSNFGKSQLKRLDPLLGQGTSNFAQKDLVSYLLLLFFFKIVLRPEYGRQRSVLQPVLKLRQNSQVERLKIYDASDDGCQEVGSVLAK